MHTGQFIGEFLAKRGDKKLSIGLLSMVNFLATAMHTQQFSGEFLAKHSDNQFT